MARAITEIEDDIRKLSPAEQEFLCLQLMEDLDMVPGEFEALAAEFAATTSKMLNSLESTGKVFEGMNKRLERIREETRKQVLESGERWPFEIPSASDSCQ